LSDQLENVAAALVCEGKGILAADETVPTPTKRFDTLGIQSTEQTRRTHREMPFTSSGANQFISGVCEMVTGAVLHVGFSAVCEQGVVLEQMLLKSNMVVPGQQTAQLSSIKQVATTAQRCLRRHAPGAVPGPVFLSGGQEDRVATAQLNAINQSHGLRPWNVNFSRGRALQAAALETWHGRDENLDRGQQAFYRRTRCNGAASRGRRRAAPLWGVARQLKGGHL
jgi:fructose-bisphosphate aldolase class I